MTNTQNRSFVGWLAASVAGSIALVGGGALVHDRPGRSSGTVTLEACDLGDGRPGYLYDDLCLSAPPAGWFAPAD